MTRRTSINGVATAWTWTTRRVAGDDDDGDNSGFTRAAWYSSGVVDDGGAEEDGRGWLVTMTTATTVALTALWL